MFSQPPRNVILNESHCFDYRLSFHGHCSRSICAVGVVEERIDLLESRYKTKRDEPLSRIYRGIDGWEESVSVLKGIEVGCRAAAVGGKAANKSCPRKRITRESRTPRREIW